MDGPQNRQRTWRRKQGFSLAKVCDLLAKQGVARPSAAKLSRIERDQVVPLGLLAALEAITAIPARMLRPEVARLFAQEAGAVSEPASVDAPAHDEAGAAP